jgi:hypothetical protein
MAQKYQVPHRAYRGYSVASLNEKSDEWVLAAAVSCHLPRWMCQGEACVSAAGAYQAVCLDAATLAAVGQQCGSRSMHVPTIVSALARIWLHGSPPGHSLACAVLD